MVITAIGAHCTFAFAQPTQHSINIPVAQIHVAETGIGQLKAIPGYGQMSQGAHGTFVKLPAGYSTPIHRHTGDYYAVVIQGVVANEQSVTAKDYPLGPGSYWFQLGNDDHVTKCLSKVDCVTFVSQSDKFDFIPAK
jgi:quercetin dioxygenase-like cupin family protein